MLHAVDVRSANECWPWTGCRDDDGYGIARYQGRKTPAHRASWAAANGGQLPPVEVKVLHSCDNPPCCNPAHLRLGSTQDNADDRVSRGRSAVGRAHGRYTRPESRRRARANGNGKLTDQQVVEIRGRITGQYGELARLAAEYQVSKSLLMKIKAGTRR